MGRETGMAPLLTDVGFLARVTAPAVSGPIFFRSARHTSLVERVRQSLLSGEDQIGVACCPGLSGEDKDRSHLCG